MNVNASRLFLSPFAILSALGSAQLGLVAAALIVWTNPLVSSKDISSSAAAIHRSLLSGFANYSRAIDRDSLIKHRDSAAINLMSDTISDFGHVETSARTLAKAIVSESQAASLDPLLIAAVIKYESSFRTHARSHRGAHGLMQVMPNTERALLKTIDTSSLATHEKQLRLGSQYLAELQKRFRGNMYHSLIAYNWGPTNLSLALKRGERIPAGPVIYAKKILAQQAVWKSELRRQARVG